MWHRLCGEIVSIGQVPGAQILCAGIVETTDLLGKSRPVLEDGPLGFHRGASAKPRDPEDPKGQPQVNLAPGASGSRAWWGILWHRFWGQTGPIAPIG